MWIAKQIGRADFDNGSLEILATDKADNQVPIWPSQVLAGL
jgi:hypothetical protein